jgi:hypothetical protein
MRLRLLYRVAVQGSSSRMRAAAACNASEFISTTIGSSMITQPSTVGPLRPHPVDPKHPGHLDDAVVLLDAARDAALFEGTPPALGSPSTEASIRLM